MTTRAPERRPARPWVKGVALLLIGAGLASWLFWGRNGAPSVGAAERATAPVVEATPTQPVLPSPTPSTPSTPSVAPALTAKATLASVEVATDGLPYMPASPDAPAPTGPVHPHPITAQHERIFRENRTIQALNDAMDSQDAKTLRRFLTRYRSEYPEDANQLQQGYELIADCLEERTFARAAAQRYFDEETASSLRRFVLRHCLGGP